MTREGWKRPAEMPFRGSVHDSPTRRANAPDLHETTDYVPKLSAAEVKAQRGERIHPQRPENMPEMKKIGQPAA